MLQRQAEVVQSKGLGIFTTAQCRYVKTRTQGKQCLLMDSYLFYCGVMAESAGHEVFNGRQAGDFPSASAT